MTPGDLVSTAFLAFVAAGLGALFWARLNRLEEKVDTMASAADLVGLRAELKEDIGALRTEFRVEFVEIRREIGGLRTEVRSDFAELRREIAGLRSDITQVALAIEPPPTRAG